MARPRKIVDMSTGKIGKDNIKKRREAEKKIKVDRDELVAPEWLRADAKEEFLRVVKAAEKIGLLDNLDLGVLTIYVNAYSGYVEVTKQIMGKKGKYTKSNKGATINKTIVNPLLITQEKFVKQIMQCSTKLGLSVTDRLKLVVPEKKDDTLKNKFAKYL